ncbi:MAG TPA: pilus assembly PilX N-terminal domain-containing protein [Bacillota bacterium]|nr:pilus assembly PilX N-terminal domain-containing protein [Bacillota bacterium]
MFRRLRRLRDDRGSALIMALLVAVVGTISLGAAGVLAQGTAREADRVRDDGSALYVAESGVNDGLHRLRFQSHLLVFRQHPQDPPSFSGGPDRVGPGGSYDVWIWPDTADPSIKHLVAVGAMGNVQRRVRVRAIIAQPNPFDPVTGGPELTPPAQAAVPLVSRPDIPCRGFLRLSGRDVLTLGNADGTPAHYCYTGIQISGQATINVLGPVHLWVSGSIQISGTADINPGGDPTRLLIWVPGTTEISINMSGTCYFRGGIWAPHSTLRISGTADLIGAVVVEDIIISGQGKIEDVFTYAPAMGDIPWPAGTPVDRHWRDYQ